MWLIVKLQAWARGARIRRGLPQLTSDTPIMRRKQMMRMQSMQNARANSLQQPQSLKADQTYDATDVEDRPAFAFNNGATYTGQWKGKDRHGRG